MSTSKGKAIEMSSEEGLFQERLQTFLDKELVDLRAFAEREDRLFDEVSSFACSKPQTYKLTTEFRLSRSGNVLHYGTANIYSTQILRAKPR